MMRLLASSVLILATAAMSGCGAKSSAAASERSLGAAAQVAVSPAVQVDWPSIYEATGTVRAKTAAQISARVMGYVREVRATAGDRVRAGQVLVILDAQDLEARERQTAAAHLEAQSAAAEADRAIESARANVELAETTFRRMKELFDKRSLSNQEFDEASARARVARASLEIAEAKRRQLDARIAASAEEQRAAQVQTGYAALAAPFDAVVTARSTEPGNLAIPGAPLLTLEQLGAYRFEANVEESHLRAVQAGGRVEVTLVSFPQPVGGTVAEIVPAVDPSSRSFTVKIDLPPSDRLRSGLFGTAAFAFGKRSVIAIPALAVSPHGQMNWVFVAEQGTARARIVTLGERRGDLLEALSGIAAGDAVIAPVPPGLTDGARIEARP